MLPYHNSCPSKFRRLQAIAAVREKNLTLLVVCTLWTRSQDTGAGTPVYLNYASQEQVCRVGSGSPMVSWIPSSQLPDTRKNLSDNYYSLSGTQSNLATGVTIGSPQPWSANSGICQLVKAFKRCKISVKEL